MKGEEMYVEITGRVLKVKAGQDSTKVTFNDVEQGGPFELNFPAQSGRTIQIDDLLTMKLVIKPDSGRFGPYFTIADVKEMKKMEK